MKKNHWNHRVLAHEQLGEVYLMIHEVYYTNEIPDTYTEDGIAVGGDNLKEIKWVLKKMNDCLKKPILWAGDKFPEEYKPIKK